MRNLTAINAAYAAYMAAKLAKQNYKIRRSLYAAYMAAIDAAIEAK